MNEENLSDLISRIANKCRAADEIWKIIAYKNIYKNLDDLYEELDKWLTKYSKCDDYGTPSEPDFS